MSDSNPVQELQDLKYKASDLEGEICKSEAIDSDSKKFLIRQLRGIRQNLSNFQKDELDRQIEESQTWNS